MSTIEWANPSSDLLSHDSEKLVSALSEKLYGRCSEAYIFGSFSNGKHDSESDIDLVIVKETTVPFTQRAKEFTDLFDIFPRLDILVYTSTEFQRMCDDKEGFFASVQYFKQIVGNQ